MASTEGVLYVASKDLVALKLCAVAQAERPFALVVVPDVAHLPKGCELPVPSSGLPVFITAAGIVIQDMNAVSELVACPALTPPGTRLAISDLLEFQASTLTPALREAPSPNSLALFEALTDLTARLSTSPYLLGEALTLPDVALGCDLLAAGCTLPEGLAAWVGRVRASPELARGAEALSLGHDTDATLVAVAKAFAKGCAVSRASQPRLPIKGARNVLITSALPYVNNVPHLGNIIGCVLSADCYARYCRARGYNSIFICGTDEYGTATETKALQEGMTCQQICDKYHTIHKEIYDWFDIEFDQFGRTPTRAQTEICQDIFTSIQARGNTVQRETEQLYSLPLGKFLADRFVRGTCPKCRYEDARGDQCDGCGNLLNPTELIDARCMITGTVPVLRSTRHVYIDLPKLTEELTEYVKTTSAQGGWSSNCLATTNTWLRDGLRERCITRDLTWGTPVPLDGFRSKVFYVWFDAPIGYVSITANYTPHWRQWWQNPEDVELVQFMGKDNVTFHTIIFPSTLLGTGQKWTMMKKISVTEYLNYEGGKFSKSRGTGVFGHEAAACGIASDSFRYYLLATRPESMDTDFKWSDLAARNNSELLNNLGNFINRAIPFAHWAFEGKVPPVNPDKGADLIAALNAEVGDLCAQYLDLMERMKIREAVTKALAVSAAGNKFFQDTQPWVLAKSDPEHAGTVVAAALGVVKVLTAMLQPYMPALVQRVLDQINGPWEWTNLGADFERDSRCVQGALPTGHLMGTPAALIRKIDDAEVAALQARFQGDQSTQASASSAATPAGAKAGAKGAPADKAAGKAAPASKPKAGAATKGETATPSAAPAAIAGTGAGDKAKVKEAKGKAAAAAPAAAVDVSRLDLRVGVIEKAWRHPEADGLYIEEIAVGEEAARTVVSGLVKYISEDKMQGRRVVVVANLKPANMRGVKSHAMVLAATSADGETVELVEPPAGAQPGERVFVEGYFDPDAAAPAQLNPKHKIFEAVHPDFSTNDALVACYRDLPLQTSAGPCTVQTVKGATIK